MTPQKIAQKYGVPLPETCKELGIGFYYKSEYEDLLDTPKTHFYWIKEKKQSEYKLDTSFTSEQYFSGYYPDKAKIECFAAPQIHEIAPLLPKDKITLNHKDNLLWFYDEVNSICIPIIDFNYSQAYAELYLALKEKGLLNS